MSNHTSTDHQAALTEAYHLVFDVKDTLTPGSSEFCLAFDAILKIDFLMDAIGLVAPRRNDRDGRPDASSIEEFVAAIEAEGGTSEGFGAAIEAEGITS